IDRRGADIVGVSRSGGARQDRTEGRDDPITKVGPGGWSQRRFQQRAENTWAENAGEVAEHTRQMAGRVHARLIVVAGDVRAVAMLEDALPKDLRELLVVTEGGRARDGSTSEIASEVVRQLDTVAARDTVELLRKFREERGQHDRVADGAEATVAALTRSQVEVLLVHDDPDDERQAWFGRDPALIATTPAGAKELGVDDPAAARLPDVVVRAALGTGAGIRVVPAAGGPRDGVGAILRWRTGN
ncbi:MAG: Vms1/Ankzf1 family peptidyl-tRNA hydrolase, partial [Acidimicrobiia bacterium]